MEVSPWPFLAIGVLVGSAGAFFIICTQILKRRISTRALELLRKGASPVQAYETLVAEGNDAAMCAQIVEKAVHLTEIRWATTLLQKCASQEVARKELVATGMDFEKASNLIHEAAFFQWCHRWRFLVAPVGLLLLLTGVAIMFFGLVLRDGNRSGKFVTFPYAGGLTIMLGIMVSCIGILFLVTTFKRSF